VRRRLVAAFGSGLLLAGVVVGGVAVAQTGGGTQYTGCIGVYGIVFQVAEGDTPVAPCGEATEISWNQEGPPGPIGPEGPQGPAAPSPVGRVIPVATDFVVAPNIYHEFPPVDTADCGSVSAHWESDANPLAKRLGMGFPGVAGSFGELTDGVGGSWERYGSGGGSFGALPVAGFDVGPATVLTLRAPSSGLTVTAWLYCIPRT
jgi:hypothetical protein